MTLQLRSPGGETTGNLLCARHAHVLGVESEHGQWNRTWLSRVGFVDDQRSIQCLHVAETAQARGFSHPQDTAEQVALQEQTQMLPPDHSRGCEGTGALGQTWLPFLASIPGSAAF